MSTDRVTFFSFVRDDPFPGKLAQSQVDGLNNILDEWERRALTDERWLAYMLATAFHESAHTMQPIREMGSEEYLRSKPYYPWVGEGLVQVTWEVNAKKFGATKPGDLMTWPIALRALFDGMINGMFTGRKILVYFNDRVDDPLNARRIINGLDRAQDIASYHSGFLAALTRARITAANAGVA